MSPLKKKILDLMKKGNPEKYDIYRQGWEQGFIEGLNSMKLKLNKKRRGKKK